MTNLESYLAIDWDAELAALARHFQGRNLGAQYIASLLEYALADTVGALCRDPAEAERAIDNICRRSVSVAVESCRSMRPATN